MSTPIIPFDHFTLEDNRDGTFELFDDQNNSWTFKSDGTFDSASLGADSLNQTQLLPNATASEITTALEGASAGDHIISHGDVTFTSGVALNTPITWHHYGIITLDGGTGGMTFLETGADGSNPSYGEINIHSRVACVQGNENVLKTTTGKNWRIRMGRVISANTVWEINPPSQTSVEYFSGNELHIAACNGCTTGWSIAPEATNVFIEGNVLRADDVVKASTPITMSGGAYNMFFGQTHSESTTEDINDSASRGGNAFYSAYTEIDPILHANSLFFGTTNVASQIRKLKATLDQYSNGNWMRLKASDDGSHGVLSETGTDGVRFNALNGAPGSEAGILQFKANTRTDFLESGGAINFRIHGNGGFGQVGFSNLAGTTGPYDGIIRNHDGSSGAGGATVPKGPAQWDATNSQWISVVDGTTFT